MLDLLTIIKNEIDGLGGNNATLEIIQKERIQNRVSIPWKKEEIEFLKTVVGKLTVQQIADCMLIPKYRVETKLRSMRKRGKIPYSEKSIYFGIIAK